MRARTPTIDQVVDAAAAHFRIPADVLTSSDIRTAAVVRARHVAIYLARKLTFRSFNQIGERFGQRDHTAALYAFDRVARSLAMSPDVADSIHTIAGALSPTTMRVA